MYTQSDDTMMMMMMISKTRENFNVAILPPYFQISTLTQCYKTQISELELKLQRETESLKKQLSAAQDNAKATAGPLRLDEANHNQYMLPVIPKEDGSDGEMDINVSMIPREEGEVS